MVGLSLISIGDMDQGGLAVGNVVLAFTPPVLGAKFHAEEVVRESNRYRVTFEVKPGSQMVECSRSSCRTLTPIGFVFLLFRLEPLPGERGRISELPDTHQFNEIVAQAREQFLSRVLDGGPVCTVCQCI